MNRWPFHDPKGVQRVPGKIGGDSGRTLDLDEYVLETGRQADIVILDCVRSHEAVAFQVVRINVVRGDRMVAGWKREHRADSSAD